MGRTPGDPTTPGWGSPRPGERGAQPRRMDVDDVLPTLLCKPVGSRVADLLLANLTTVGDGPIGPGFASEESAEPEERPILTGNLKIAHYGGVSPEEAAEIWKAETLCLTCLSAGVCRIAAGTGEPLVVVSRCLAYIPGAG